MDFEADIREHVLAHLPYPPEFESELRQKPIEDLAIIYGNWCSRHIQTRPRTVHKSAALRLNPQAVTFERVLVAITEKVKTGVDITPHLSRRIRHGYVAPDTNKPKALNRRKDLDLLLNDWGMHHLHLSTMLEADGFVSRTGPLLFVIFRHSDAYLVDIAEHGDWTNDQMIDVVIKEWPTIGAVAELKGVLPPTQQPSAKERQTLRNAGINSPLVADGKVFFPLAGLTTAGTAGSVTMAVIHLFKGLKRFIAMMSDDPDFVAKSMSSYGVETPATPDLHFAFFEDGGYGIIERITGFRFRLL